MPKDSLKWSPELFSQLEERVTKGHIKEVVSQLRKVSPRRIPRHALLQWAVLARRCHENSLSLSLLHPCVVAPKPGAKAATTEEKSVYASALAKIGAADEAIKRLSILDPDEVPSVLLHHTYALFTKWEYEQCISLLTRFLTYDEVPEKERTVAEVNLIACLIQEDLSSQARELIPLVRSRTEQLNQKTLTGATYELEAQMHLKQNNYSQCRSALDSADELLRDSGSITAFFVSKWRAVLALQEHGDSSPLKKIQQEAVERNHWETVRACDLLLGVHYRDVELLSKVYFGTPSESFRVRVFREMSTPIELPSYYDWSVSGAASKKVIDIQGSSRMPKLTQVQERLLKSLCIDFYRPFLSGHLHALIYPGEYFNPTSSPHRVQQALSDFRKRMKKLRWPIAIMQSSGGYEISPDSAVTIRVGRQKEVSSFKNLRLSILSKKFGIDPFTSTTASQILKLSKRTVVRLLNQATENQLIEKEGESTTRKYRFRSAA